MNDRACEHGISVCARGGTRYAVSAVGALRVRASHQSACDNQMERTFSRNISRTAAEREGGGGDEEHEFLLQFPVTRGCSASFFLRLSLQVAPKVYELPRCSFCYTCFQVKLQGQVMCSHTCNFFLGVAVVVPFLFNYQLIILHQPYYFCSFNV